MRNKYHHFNTFGVKKWLSKKETGVVQIVSAEERADGHALFSGQLDFKQTKGSVRSVV